MIPPPRDLLVAAAVGALLAACGNAQFPSDPSAGGQMCRAICARRHECRSDSDESACRSSCRAGGGSWAAFGGDERAYWRPEYVATILHCTASASCPVAEDDGRLYSQCWMDTQDPPSDLAVTLCSRFAQKTQQCGGQVHGCTRLFGPMNDAALRGLIACTDLACNDAIRCWSSFVTTMN